MSNSSDAERRGFIAQSSDSQPQVNGVPTTKHVDSPNR